MQWESIFKAPVLMVAQFNHTTPLLAGSFNDYSEVALPDFEPMHLE